MGLGTLLQLKLDRRGVRALEYGLIGGVVAVILLACEIIRNTPFINEAPLSAVF